MARVIDGMAIVRRVARSIPAGTIWRKRLDDVELGKQVGIHLGVFIEPFLQAILDGRKTIESRFGIHRCTPFRRVQPGDIIFLKRSGGPVVGIALAGEAQYYELTPRVLNELKTKFSVQLCVEDEAFWRACRKKRFASLIEIEDRLQIRTVDVEKRDRRGWVTFAEAQQCCLKLNV